MRFTMQIKQSAWATMSPLMALMMVLLVACEPPPSPPEPPTAGEVTGGEAGAGVEAGASVACEPDCEGRVCGVDPRCGVSCGVCEGDERCEAGLCVMSASAGAQEGGASAPLAGQEPTGGSGGASGGEEPVCAPQCTGQACGEPDGCGGSCSPCPRAVSCEGCALRLRVLELGELGGRVTSARLALELELPEGAPHPEMADIHITLKGPALIGRVGLGEASVSAQKQLIPDPATGLPYRASGERYSFMLLSTQNTNTIPSGQLLIIELQLGDTRSAPVTLNVIQREQTFAPPPADLQLWGSPTSEGVVIWPALSQGE